VALPRTSRGEGHDEWRGCHDVYVATSMSKESDPRMTHRL
jgi:hypothetical protein